MYNKLPFEWDIQQTKMNPVWLTLYLCIKFVKQLLKRFCFLQWPPGIHRRRWDYLNEITHPRHDRAIHLIGSIIPRPDSITRHPGSLYHRSDSTVSYIFANFTVLSIWDLSSYCFSSIIRQLEQPYTLFYCFSMNSDSLLNQHLYFQVNLREWCMISLPGTATFPSQREPSATQRVAAPTRATNLWVKLKVHLSLLLESHIYIIHGSTQRLNQINTILLGWQEGAVASALNSRPAILGSHCEYEALVSCAAPTPSLKRSRSSVQSDS